MQVTVRLFAKARDLAGAECVTVDLPESARVGDLRAALCERYPNLRPLAPSLLISIGTDYANDDSPIRLSEEIACFPPVSGG